jgi:hypothetical protein
MALPALLLLYLFQRPVPMPASIDVKAFEDIEIGMLQEDGVIVALVRQGYTVKVPKPSEPPGRTVSLKGNCVGSFFVDGDGRVSAAQEKIYPISEDGNKATALADALYWLIHDEGQVVESKDKNKSSTRTDAVLLTDDFVSRSADTSIKRFTIETKAGGIYSVDLVRYPGYSSVDIYKIAPFSKKR